LFETKVIHRYGPLFYYDALIYLEKE